MRCGKIRETELHSKYRACNNFPRVRLSIVVVVSKSAPERFQFYAVVWSWCYELGIDDKLAI